MAILMHNRSADWNQGLYEAVFDRVVPDRSNLPAGLVAHFGAPGAEGGWQVIEVWESEEASRRFLEEAIILLRGTSKPRRSIRRQSSFTAR